MILFVTLRWNKKPPVALVGENEKKSKNKNKKKLLSSRLHVGRVHVGKILHWRFTYKNEQRREKEKKFNDLEERKTTYRSKNSQHQVFGDLLHNGLQFWARRSGNSVTQQVISFNLSYHFLRGLSKHTAARARVNVELFGMMIILSTVFFHKVVTLIDCV